MLIRHTFIIDLVVISLLYGANIILGMTWLQSVHPIIDWESGEKYILNGVSISLIQGEWL